MDGKGNDGLPSPQLVKWVGVPPPPHPPTLPAPCRTVKKTPNIHQGQNVKGPALTIQYGINTIWPKSTNMYGFLSFAAHVFPRRAKCLFSVRIYLVVQQYSLPSTEEKYDHIRQIRQRLMFVFFAQNTGVREGQRPRPKTRSYNFSTCDVLFSLSNDWKRLDTGLTAFCNHYM